MRSSRDAGLDALDRSILRVLQKQGDIAGAELAQRVAASPASCWRRISAMEKAGVLLGHVRIVDPIAIGRGLDVICQVRMKTHDATARARFEAFVQAHDQVMECHHMSGEWDYLLRIAVESVHDYQRFLMDELLTQDMVATSASHFSLKRVKYTTALPV